MRTDTHRMRARGCGRALLLLVNCLSGPGEGIAALDPREPVFLSHGQTRELAVGEFVGGGMRVMKWVSSDSSRRIDVLFVRIRVQGSAELRTSASSFRIRRSGLAGLRSER
jgi:hypothetical protein